MVPIFLMKVNNKTFGRKVFVPIFHLSFCIMLQFVSLQEIGLGGLVHGMFYLSFFLHRFKS